MTIWVVNLERHEQRYTGEWAHHLPEQVRRAVAAEGSDECVRTIDGSMDRQTTSPGAFLDFARTNIFKADQVAQIARLFTEGAICPGDRLLFADAWHPGIISTRYMSDLLQVDVRMFGFWHAGSYDRNDFLGRIPDTDWAHHFERAIYHALHVNCFATHYHMDTFSTELGIDDRGRMMRTGWPMDYLPALLQPQREKPKRNLILFPHRPAPEKQPEIFRDLSSAFPDYEFRVCQETPLAKSEYHELLGQTKLVFSSSLQETLGIGVYEGLLAGAKVLVPDRLSYSEMYPALCRYPTEWTATWDGYRINRSKLIDRMASTLALPDQQLTNNDIAKIGETFFEAAPLLAILARRPSPHQAST